MAFCSNCGKENAPGSAFCEGCGAALPQEAPAATPVTPEYQAQPQQYQAQPQQYEAQPQQFGQPQAPKAKKELPAFLKNKKLLGIICGVVVVVIVLIIVLVNVLGGKGPEAQIKDAVKTLNKRPVTEKELAKTNLNDYAAEVAKEEHAIRYNGDFNDDYDSFDEYLEEYMEESYEDLDDKFGDDWKMEVQIKKVKDYTEKDDEFEEAEEYWESYVENLEDMADDYEEYADWYDEEDDAEMYEQLAEVYAKYADKYADYKVTAVKEVKIKLNIEGEDGHDSDTTELLFAKVNGKWIKISGYFFNFY